MTIGTNPAGHAVKIDLPRLIETRMLVQANSGAGKSWTLRRILEQTHSKCQQIVLDVEDEFYTLREKYDYVLAGRHGGDCQADVRSAPLLARRLLELGVSAIVGIYELKYHDKIQFVKLFLESLVSAPRDLWHPCMIVVDEAHIFAPQTGQAESSSALIDLMTRGRKRGFCGIIATQRISKLHKDAAAEANNKLIGRSSLDVDMKRAADELGFSSREDMLSLRNLEDGEFYAFGPAISNVVTRCKVGPVETTHPKAGQRAAPPPPPKDKVQKVLAQLADLPKEAEQEQASRMELQKRVRELEGELRRASTATQVAAPVKIDPDRLKREFDRGAQSVKVALAREFRLYVRAADQTWNEAAQSVIAARGAIEGAVKSFVEIERPIIPSLEDIIEQVKTSPPVGHIPASNIPARVMAAAAPGSIHRPMATRPPREISTSNGSLASGERKILTALAQYPQGRTKRQVAILTAYAVNGGGFNNYLSALRGKGFIDGSGNSLRITDEGTTALGSYDPLPVGSELLEHWRRQLGKAEILVLDTLATHYPQALSKEQVAELAGYAADGGGFNNALSRLRTLELIQGRGELRASDELFG